MPAPLSVAPRRTQACGCSTAGMASDMSLSTASSRLARRHPIASFYALTLLLSWGYWGALLGQGARVEPGSPATHLPGLAGPAIAAMLVSCARGSTSVWRLACQLGIRSRPSLQDCLLALSPVAITLACIQGFRWAGAPSPPLHDFLVFPGLPADWPALGVLTAVLLANGIGEELGWRGYLAPLMARTRGEVGATLCVFGMWLLWHAPLFILQSNLAALVGPTLIGWAFGLLCGAFLLRYLQIRSASVLVPAMWHTAFNLSVATPAGHGPIAAVQTSVAICFGLGVAMKWLNQARRTQRSMAR